MDPYMQQFNSEFTLDIDNKMQVPSRISMAGDSSWPNPTYHLNPDLNYIYGFSPMDVPSKILVTGSDSHVEVRRDSLVRPSGDITKEVLDPNGVTKDNWTEEDIMVDVPPSNMTLSKVNYPDIENNFVTQGFRDLGGDDLEEKALHIVHRKIEYLQNKLDFLESREEARKKMDYLIAGTVGLFGLYVVYSVLFSRNP